MEASPVKNEQREREQRWMRPAGIAGILGVAAIIVGGLIRSSALDGDSISAEMLDAAGGDADGKLLLSTVVSGLSFVLFSLLLTHLFLAARARSSRVLAPFVGLALIGGVLILAGQIAGNSAFLNASDDFAASEAAREAPEPGAEGAADSSEDSGDDAEDEADDRARDAREDASGATLAGVLGAAGGLAFAIGYFYTSLWAMRTGLLTRFWGSLGMAAAVVSVILPPFFVIVMFWFLATSLLMLGLWAGGRPPAWEAGVAVPWPRPGDEPEAADDAIEGHGRELSEKPLPEDGNGSGGSDGPQGPPPQKRKRRR